MEIKLLKEFSISLRMGQIEAGPPLSTIIGNVGGINSVKFFKELNEYTKVLPNYFMLEVKIKIFMDKSYIFTVVEPSTALLLRLISKKIEVKLKSSGG
jgi:ribosomal protein L11